MIDLDHFKQLNDSLGHETGDRALRFFAHTLRDSVREQDLVARYGGEEFAVIFPGTGSSEAAMILERVRDALRAGHQMAGMPPVTASFGVVDAEDDELLDELFRRADALAVRSEARGPRSHPGGRRARTRSRRLRARSGRTAALSARSTVVVSGDPRDGAGGGGR